MPPPIPAGTIAALATIPPLGALSVETFRFDCPSGQTDRKFKGPKVTAVKFSE